MDNTTACVQAIRAGDVERLNQLLDADPALANARIGDDGARTMLHVATDWPGHLPNIRGIVTALVAHGADVNARFPRATL
jgi:hypothetical protein